MNDFLHSLDPLWLDDQFQRWQRDKLSVPSEWRAFFAGYEFAGEMPAGPDFSSERCQDCSRRESAVQTLIDRYRELGHLLSCTDPLSPCRISHPLLDLTAFGLTDADLQTEFATPTFHLRRAKLEDVLANLRDTYCRSIGVEFMHLQEPTERQWLIERMEPSRNRRSWSRSEQLAILRRLQESALFESFLHRKFPGQKRFSLEGGESLIVFLEQLIAAASGQGVTDLVLGMPHRGRLNLLATILGKPLPNIFAEFADNLEQGFVGEGDVKYHKGFSADRDFPGGHRVHLTLAFNPSHLELVGPVVEGKARARQDLLREDGPKRVLPLVIHGDAAFAGQGIVAETFNLSQLDGYRTGGTVHLVLNNQIGFTTLPKDARSTRYATDLAKMLAVPIFHLHGEDPEAISHIAHLAAEYRQRFARDFVVELVCYRRHGHNEGDEPYFTQPLMYKRIQERPPVHRLYAAFLAEQGLAPEDAAAGEEQVLRRLEAAVAESPLLFADRGFAGQWSSVRRGYEPTKVDTGVPAEFLRDCMVRLVRLPEGFVLHPKVDALLQRRHEAVISGKGLDWGAAETLAYATLLHEGTSVRVSGQDCRRGTFNHRHAALYDQQTGEMIIPLGDMTHGGARFQIHDSMLSELAVLGFEYGYSLADPRALVIWEAQFGDFANGAQPIIDQFIVSGESKWDRSSGLVMLLPHGYEGQGAEHSSARIERFLQLCAEENLLVTYPTTPAQLFHLLRRQVRLPFRKPLVVFSPKSLFRHPACISDLSDLGSGWFREVLGEDHDYRQIRRILFCTGKFYYELSARRQETGCSDTAIVRIEQLYPLRIDLLKEVLAPLHRVERFVWAQEEPANMGAWQYLRQPLTELCGSEPEFRGRGAAAAPAVGSHRQHGIEQQQILHQLFPGDEGT